MKSGDRLITRLRTQHFLFTYLIMELEAEDNYTLLGRIILERGVN